MLKRKGKLMQDSENNLVLVNEKDKGSWLSRLTYYEYLGFNIGSFLFSKFLKKFPAVNGSAFAVKREVLEEVENFDQVIVEDLDFATKAFLKNFKFKYSTLVKVYNHVHSNFKRWIVQRKRWYIGAAFWIKRWWKDLLKFCCHKPQLVLLSLIFLYPSFTLLLIHLLLSNSLFYKFFSVSLLFLSLKFTYNWYF